ncbi:helix-turn-helix domain-containing protein [Herbiconiux ginsengi]|uniref:Transcriptional regulator, AraC family n=1 Tax=Herbiconiux ginsengi TaxID=381665 RepID=A0A1H3LYA7_9MICO|nr:helix-turn-helix domain-containing protein [Herbiconiux ginsengi]SDY69422.1 transcriptional regulator, AraC family [Herbiconiux ginsengi]
MNAEVGADGGADARAGTPVTADDGADARARAAGSTSDGHDAPVVSRGILFPAESAPVVRLDRYRPSADLAAFVRHYWIPRWSLPPGQTHEELLLQYATCNLVVSDGYAALFGLARGVGSRTLEGTGWAFGVMLQPGTARALLDARREAGGRARAGATAGGHEDTTSVGPLGTERTVASLSEAPAPLDGLVTSGAALAARIRSLHDDDTGMIAAFEQWLRGLRLDAARGAVINEIVHAVETEPELRTVDELATRFGLGVRSLQRLTAEFVGMNPKWLLQRQRLQDAAARLRESGGAHDGAGLAGLAAELGYADQAHFSRDFARAVGMAPGEYSRRTQVESGRNVPELRSEGVS